MSIIKDVLAKIKQIDPDLEVVMVTAVNEVQKASQAIKMGARDYLIKPFDVATIIKMSEQILRRKNLLRQFGAAYWMRYLKGYEVLRFERLCSYLSQREPDDEVGYSILIYRLSDSDLSAALGAAPGK